jgi:hypothetical protein
VREYGSMDNRMIQQQVLQQRVAREKQMARLKAEGAWKNFLETVPPNVPATIENLFDQHHPQARTETWSVALPEIELHCETCDGRRIFATGSDHLFGDWKFVTYKCKNCEEQSKTFALIAQQAPKNSPKTTAEVMKIGEFPPFGGPVSRRVAKLLGEEDLELYRKGMRAEAQGLGIGAASYFRRIVDNQWHTLVDEIRDASAKLGETDLSLYEAAKKETQFKKAVEMLSEAIPPKLLILGGENPLTLLYRALSVELHDLTDSECLQQANDIRLVLTALLENIAEVMRDKDELKEAVTRLRQVKS